jgi:hypothetical protein
LSALCPAPFFTMKFPITREALQAFDPVKDQEELFQERIEETVKRVVAEVCRQVAKHLYESSGPFVYQHLRLLLVSTADNTAQMTPQYKGRLPFDYTVKNFLPPLFEKLKETFIDCDITIDPVENSLIINWT